MSAVLEAGEESTLLIMMVIIFNPNAVECVAVELCIHS